MNTLLILQLLWLLNRWRTRDRWTRQQLDEHQRASLGALREFTYARSTFYQRFHRGLFDRPLRELPVLTKGILMEHFDELVTDPAIHLDQVTQHVAGMHGDERFLGRYRVCATSGSTGHRGFFLFDSTEWLMVLASFARAHEWAGLELRLTHRMRMASVASTAPWHMSTRVSTTLASPWMPALRLGADEPIHVLVDRLNAWQPEMLVAYPSIARTLADEQNAERLGISPHLIFTSSEVLTPGTRQQIEATWGRTLFDQYGVTEAGGLAAECTAHRGMHLDEDLVICEVVDEQNQPVSQGTFGAKLLITVLFSRTLPLIRYEVSDSLQLGTDLCPCGRPFALVTAIQGREEDVLHLPAIAGNAIAVQPLLFHRVMDAAPVGTWQIVEKPDGLHVLLSGMREGFSPNTLVAVLQRELAAQGVKVPILVQPVAAIPRGPNGKVTLIVASPRAMGERSLPLSSAVGRIFEDDTAGRDAAQ